MPKGKKTTSIKPVNFKVATLLAIPLTLVGKIPLLLIFGIWYLLYQLVKAISNLRLSLNLPVPKKRKPLFFKKIRRLKRLFFKKTSRTERFTLSLLSILAFFTLYTALIFQSSSILNYPQKLVSSIQPLTTEIHDRNGKLLYRIYEGKNRSLISLKDIPPYLIQATIATEDKNFYKHPGFDPMAIFRAIRANLTGGRNEGASTITQQLVKNNLLTPEKTISRKIKEILLAFWAERIYSKNQILEMYLNGAPYGGPAWGIEAAAQTYFGKGAKDLNLSEATFLAGLPASPTNFSPYGKQPELAKGRQKYVLDRMVEEGYLRREVADEAFGQTLNLKPPINDIEAPHFVFFVKDLLVQKYGERTVSQGGLKVITTLDLDLQQKVEEIVKTQIDNLASLNVKNGAAMVMDAKTGQILSMVGSRDYYYPDFGNFNVALSLRQPGSSIKVITYATGFKKGYSPGNTILDTPVTFHDVGSSYSPVNYDGAFHGPVSIRTALGSSYNIPAVRMLATVGMDEAIKTARDLGITTFTDPKNYGLSLTLGGAEVKMIDMMSVYGSFSQNGKKNTPTPILKVTDSDGNLLENYHDSAKQVLDPPIAYLITHILTDNEARKPSFGSNSLLNISPDVAVKTGTTDNKRDNWTFGYDSQFVVGVWVGNPDNSPMNPQLTSGITGAAPIWHQIMKTILASHLPTPFPKPDGISEVAIDGRKDLALSGSIPKSLVRITRADEKTIFSDDFGQFATPSAAQAQSQEQIAR